MKIELNGEYVTQCGREHRLFVVDAQYSHAWPVRGEAKGITGEWVDMAWNAQGKSSLVFCRDYDLVPKPKRIKKTYWLNLYGHGDEDFAIHLSRQTADGCARCGRTECVRVDIDIPEGEGLSAAEAGR